jgi:hypothetical protein
MIRTLATLLLLATASLAPGQSEPVSTRILTYAPAGLPESFQSFYRTGQKVEPFLASAGTLGLPIEYQGPPVFALYGSKADLETPADGSKPKPPLAVANLPAGSDCVLLVCTRTAGDKVGLKAYDIRSQELKTGDYRVFNFSRTPVSVILGENRFALQPGKDSFVRDPKWHREMLALPIQIAAIANGKPKLVFSTFWEHYPQRRSLLFLFDGKHASEPVVFANFSADLPARKPATGAAATAP